MQHAVFIGINSTCQFYRHKNSIGQISLKEYFYHMKNYQLLLIALLSFSSCSTNSRTAKNNVQQDSVRKESKKDTVKKALFATLQIKDTIKAGDAARLKFTIYNQADSAQQFCKWHTPFEPLISKYLEVKDESGEEAVYLGAMARRMMPPPASSYIKVNAKDSLSANVDLLKAYRITKPAKYMITYVGQNMSGLEVKQSVSFVYVK